MPTFQAGIRIVFGFLIVLSASPFFSESRIAVAQTCTHFLNATDGDDGSTGTSASSAVRTLEHAFLSFPSGSVVCMTAGEYFQGSDADGVQLAGQNARDKSMTFVLQTFAGNDVVGITEDEFVIDIGSGSITFRPGSTTKLFFGEGTVNNSSDFPGHTNFLHSLHLVSGTIDVEGVDLSLGSSLGNPFFQDGSSDPPASAAITRHEGAMRGVPEFLNGFRRIRYEGEGSRTAGPELPDEGRLDVLFNHTAGTIVIPGSLTFIEGAISTSNAGAVRFDANVIFADASDGSISSNGDGTLFIKSLTAVLSSDADMINVERGSVEIERLELLAQDGVSDVHAVITNHGNLVMHSVLTTQNVSGVSPEVFAANSGTLFLGSPSMQSPANLHIENRATASAVLVGAPVLAGRLVNEGEIEILGSATLEREVINSGKMYLAGGNSGQITLTLSSTLENTGAVDLGSQLLLLSSAGEHPNNGVIANGTLAIAGDVQVTGEGILPSIQVREGDAVVSAQRIVGGISCEAAAGIHLDAVDLVEDGMDVNCGITHDGPLDIGGDLELAGGTMSVSDAVRVAGDMQLQSSATLQIEAATLSLAGDFVRHGGEIQMNEGEIAFDGGRAQRLDSVEDLVLSNLSIKGAGTNVISETPTLLTGDLIISEQGRLSLDDGQLRLVGSSSTARIIGLVQTTGSGALEFAGPTGSEQSIQGGGLVGNMLIDLDDEEDVVAVAATGITQSGVLTISRGSLVVDPAAALVLSSELGMPTVNRNLGDDDQTGESDGKGIVANVDGSGTLHTPDGLDVSYYGLIAEAAEAGVELLTDDLRNLSINLETHGGARGTLHVRHDVGLLGNLSVGTNTNIDMAGYSIIALGEEAHHRIDGTIEGGSFIVEGSGTVQGSPIDGLWLDTLIIRSFGTVETHAAGSIQALNLDRGLLSLSTPEIHDIVSYRQQGQDSRLHLRSSIGITEAFGVDGGQIETGSFDIVLRDGAHLLGANQTTWDSDATGHLVFSGDGLIVGDETVLSRLKVDGAVSDTVHLGGTLRISSSLMHEGGTIHLAENTLHLAGRLWSVTNGTYSGAGAVAIQGNLDAEFLDDVWIPSLVVGVAGLQTVFSIRARTEEPVSLAADEVRLDGGTTDLTNNDIRIGGTEPRLIAAGGLLDMTTAPSVDPEANGEIVFDGPGTLQLDEALTISNLRLIGDVTLTGAPNALTVAEQLMFSGGNLSGTAGQLVLEAGARFVRRGGGIPLVTPELRGLIDVVYYTDGTPISGSLNTGPELPDEVRDLVIDAGLGTSNDTNSIRLVRDVRVHRRLSLFSGVLDVDKSSIHMAAGSEVRIDYRREPTPRFAEGSSYITEGPITLSYMGGTGNLSSDELTFPANADIETLHVRMGDDDTQTARHFFQHALRRIDHLIIDHLTSSSSFDLSGATLIVDAATDVAAGRLTSSKEGIMEVGGVFHVREGASADGVLSVSVEGATVIDGTFKGHLLSARGNVSVAGELGGPDRELDADAPGYVPGLPNVILRGRNQILSLSTEDDDPSSVDESINRLTVALDTTATSIDGPSLFVESLDGNGVVLGINHLELTNGVLSIGENVITLPSNGNGFSRASESVVSHVVGSIRRSVDAGQPNPSTKQFGRFLFPVGADYPHAVYRPVAFVFEQETPAMMAYAITVAHHDTPPGRLRGFPTSGGSDILLDDAAPFHWIVQSSPAFPSAQVFSLQFLATDLDLPTSVGRTRMVRRSASDDQAIWRLHADPSDYDNARVSSADIPSVFIQTRDTRDGIGSDSTLFTVGLERAARNFARVQLVHDAPPEELTVRVNDDVIYTHLRPGQATPYLRIEAGEHELVLEENGDEVIRVPLVVENGRDYVVIATGRRRAPETEIFVRHDAKATVDPGVHENVQVSLFNGYNSSVDVTFLRGTPGEASFHDIMPGGFTDTYVEAPPDLLKFDVEGGPAPGSHRADFRSFSGLTATAIVADGLDEAIVVSSEGERLRSYTVVSDETPQAIPVSFALHGNYPNPFNPSTQILIDLPEAAVVTVEVFDLIGRRVMRSDAGAITAGANRSLEIHAAGLSSGIYVYRVTAHSSTTTYSSTGRFSLVK